MLRGGSHELVGIGELAGLRVKTIHYQIALIGRHGCARHHSTVFVDRYTANDDTRDAIRRGNGEGA